MRYSFHFLFRSSGSHRDLHSFPTRRSSDLLYVRNREAALQERTDALLEAERRKDEFLAVLAHELRNPDRKSTRLNSSHTVISYAVFCLKKKKLETKDLDNNIEKIWSSGKVH